MRRVERRSALVPEVEVAGVATGRTLGVGAESSFRCEEKVEEVRGVESEGELGAVEEGSRRTRPVGSQVSRWPWRRRRST